MVILSIFFFITAIFYSSVGFGGGSTYLALLLIWKIPYYIFPIIALFCNIIVVTGSSINYIRTGNLNLKLLIPYLIGSIPFAFLGASISIEKELFEILLFFVLIVAGIFLLIESKSFNKDQIKIRQIPKILSIFNWFCNRIYFRYCWYWRWYIFKSILIFNESWISKAYCNYSFSLYFNKFYFWCSRTTNKKYCIQ